MKYTKKEILASQKYEKWREWLKVNLPDEGTFTHEEVEDFMRPLFYEINADVKGELVYNPTSKMAQSGSAVTQAIERHVLDINHFPKNTYDPTSMIPISGRGCRMRSTT